MLTTITEIDMSDAKTLNNFLIHILQIFSAHTHIAGYV